MQCLNIVGEIRVTNFDCINSGFCDAKFLYKGKKTKKFTSNIFVVALASLKTVKPLGISIQLSELSECANIRK